jgi:hypothetical protein
MIKERLTTALFLALAVHLALSLAVIASAGFLIKTHLSKIYRTHLLPGPFFDADRIVYSYSLYVSWKSNGRWSPPVSPAKDNFIRYNQQFNPTTIYRSRFERSLYQGLVVKPDRSGADIGRDIGFQQLTRYLSDYYGPRAMDSMRVLITRRNTTHFKTSLDTLYVIAQ